MRKRKRETERVKMKGSEKLRERKKIRVSLCSPGRPASSQAFLKLIERHVPLSLKSWE